MTSKRTNVLREYHVLVKREAQGFEWQIRYDRHAIPVQRSQMLFATHQEAIEAGDSALAALKSNVPEME